MAKKEQPEIEALYGVLAKLSEKYKNLIAFALDDLKYPDELYDDGLVEMNMKRVKNV